MKSDVGYAVCSQLLHGREHGAFVPLEVFNDAPRASCCAVWLGMSVIMGDHGAHHGDGAGGPFNGNNPLAESAVRVDAVAILIGKSNPPQCCAHAVPAPTFHPLPVSITGTKAEPGIDRFGAKGSNAPGVDINRPGVPGSAASDLRPLVYRQRRPGQIRRRARRSS